MQIWVKNAIVNKAIILNLRNVTSLKGKRECFQKTTLWGLSNQMFGEKHSKLLQKGTLVPILKETKNRFLEYKISLAGD